MPKWAKGQKVLDLDDDGKLYNASIGLRHKDETYKLNWEGKWADTFTDNVPDDKMREMFRGIII